MPIESGRHREQNQKYTIVVLPTSGAGTTRSITVGKVGLLAVGCGAFIIIAALVLGLLVYTPLGLYVPIPNPELENRYNKQIVAIQERLKQLMDNLVSLREYNLRLRKALGENISPDDSTFLSAQSITQRRDRRMENQQLFDNREFGNQHNVSISNRVGSRRPETVPPPTFVLKVLQIELPLTLPVRGYITQEFDPEQQHFGIDFAGKEGSNIFAAADGSVIFAGWTYDDGYMIMLAHGNGYRTTYKHNQTLLKTPGAFVRRGEPIALLGNSGKTSYGPHLHFEVWKDGIPQNPKEFLLTLE